MINRLQLTSRLATVAIGTVQPPLTTAKNRVASSIALMGVLDEVKVAPLENDSRYSYRILDGGRRFDSLQAAGCQTLEVKIFEADEVILQAITAVSNLCRSHNFVREAQALQTIGHLSANLDEIALATGLSQHAIRAALKLANLPEDILEAVGDTLSSGVVKRLAQLAEFEQQALIADIRRATAAGRRYTQKHYRKSLERVRPHQPNARDAALLEPNVASIAGAILSPEQLERLEQAGLRLSLACSRRAPRVAPAQTLH